MSKQTQTQKRKPRTEPAPEQETETHDTAATDELLGDIDDVLEEMGEELASQYIQKGGQAVECPNRHLIKRWTIFMAMDPIIRLVRTVVSARTVGIAI